MFIKKKIYFIVKPLSPSLRSESKSKYEHHYNIINDSHLKIINIVFQFENEQILYTNFDTRFGTYQSKLNIFLTT